MKKLIGFISGAVFTVALIVTCGGGGSGRTTDAGTAPSTSDTALSSAGLWDTGLFDTVAPLDIGVGEAHAQATAPTKWEYLLIYSSLSSGGSASIIGPTGYTLDLAACSGNTGDRILMCALNIAGSDGWELVIADSSVSSGSTPTAKMKRPKS